MRRRGHMGLATRLLAAIALLFAVFAHQAPAARALDPVTAANLTLPDGTIADICVGLVMIVCRFAAVRSGEKRRCARARTRVLIGDENGLEDRPLPDIDETADRMMFLRRLGQQRRACQPAIVAERRLLFMRNGMALIGNAVRSEADIGNRAIGQCKACCSSGIEHPRRRRLMGENGK